jgi:competence protein ComEA
MSALKFFMILVLVSGSLAADFTTVEGVVFVPTSWGDGDSFRVRFPDGTEHTIRLYGADTLEDTIRTDSDARRLRAQRRYFGISNYGGSPQASIELAKAMGEAATLKVKEWLATPFTVHTTFADARGSPRFPRIYAFVTTSEGEDLATLLVREGLARAFGVYRSTPDGMTHHDYRELLRDAELVAARKGRGIWAFTDWETFSEERRDQRREDLEFQVAMGRAAPTERVNLNTAEKQELVRIPGVGEVTAAAIVEARPFRSMEELTRVRGIGPARLAQLQEWLTLD